MKECSHIILNSVDHKLIVNYLLYDTLNIPMKIVTNTPEMFSDIFKGIKGRSEITIEDISSKRGKRITPHYLESIIENTDEGNILFFHNILNSFSFYDKGDRRLINFLMRIVMSKKHHYIMNLDSYGLNRILIDGNINTIYKNHENSNAFITQIRRDNFIATKYNEDTWEFDPTAFRTPGSFINYCSKFYSAVFYEAVKDIRHLCYNSPSMSLNAIYRLSTNYNSGFSFSNIHKLAEALNINFRFVLVMISLYVLNMYDGSDKYMEMQFKFYYGLSNPEVVSEFSEIGKYTKEFMTSSYTKLYSTDTFSSSKPLKAWDYLISNNKEVDSEKLFEVCSLAFGPKGRVPMDIFNAAGYTGVPPVWRDIMIKSHTDPNAVKERSIVNKCLQIMAYQGIISPLYVHPKLEKFK